MDEIDIYCSACGTDLEICEGCGDTGCPECEGWSDTEDGWFCPGCTKAMKDHYEKYGNELEDEEYE